MIDDPQPSDAAAPVSRSSKRSLRICCSLVALAVVGIAGTGAWRFATGPERSDVAVLRVADAAESSSGSAEPARVALAAIDIESIDLLRAALREQIPPTPMAWSNAEGVAPTPFVEQAPAPEARADAQLAELPARAVPLPIGRPPEFRFPADAPRRAERRVRRVQVATADPAAVEDNRNFFEQFFGIEKPATPAPALAYASVGSPPADKAPLPRLSPTPTPPQTPAPSAGGGTAIYDISARTVTLPNGETLEAHSGLGQHMDDPKNVHLRMRGSTPPGTYDLTEREALFHGVRAIRLNPVGGAESIFGRAGLLAHTYMLGTSGQSNGCVSFRDYNRFLQAYLRGEVTRLVVVPGVKQDILPSIAEKLFGKPTRTASAATDG